MQILNLQDNLDFEKVVLKTVKVLSWENKNQQENTL